MLFEKKTISKDEKIKTKRKRNKELKK